MSGGGTAFDITTLMVPYLDTHMIIPMLDFLRDPNSVLRDEKSTHEDKVREGGSMSYAVAASLHLSLMQSCHVPIPDCGME